MPEKWTGRLIGKMHNERVTYDDLAAELGVTKSYVSMILNGVRKPKGIQERMEAAFEIVVNKRKGGLHDS
jgi:transcriptional regulator with XRE-family HTH domain